MHSVLLAAVAICNVPLYFYPAPAVPDVAWPTHATITLPQGYVKADQHLAVLENGQPMLAQVEVAARWPDGSPKWVHAYGSFKNVGGKPANYQLVRQPQPAELPKSPLSVVDEPKQITIDTGTIKLVIPRPFAGISLIEHEGKPVVQGPGGPSLVDGNGRRWHTLHDADAQVVVEQQGPAQVIVKATGWYQSADKKEPPFCRFTTRITAAAGSAIVKIDHATTFAGDMKQHAIAELSFGFGLPGATAFSSHTHRGTFSDKLRATWIAQLTDDKVWRLVQTGADPVKDLKSKGAFERSAGWFAAQLPGKRVALLTKDFWQKCPKEVKLAPDSLVYYAWPEHGDLVKPDPTETRLENIYKFQCFQRGKLLTSKLPDNYLEALKQQKDTDECKAEYAQAANMHGISMRNEFALAIVPDVAVADARLADQPVEKLQQVFLQNPALRVSPAAMAFSGVWGPVAAASSDPKNEHFPDQEKLVVEAMLGYARSIERYNDYGWAIYGNTHHEELMNPDEAGIPGGRPTLHRVWNNNHYGHVSTTWKLFAMTGDPRLLQWARTCTDTYSSLGQVRYDTKWPGMGLRNDTWRPTIKYHFPGAFFHCKGLVPWGGRDYKMDANDVDAALWGHWPDPSALLTAWLMDANRWALDGYELWLDQVKLPTGHISREINYTLVQAINAYEYRPTPEILAAIQGMRKGLTSKPILQQRPGPLWEPTWLSRYHELFPDDEEFNQFLVRGADEVGAMDEGIWTLAISATAYRITGDDKYLKRHGATLDRNLRQLFHDEHKDKRWEGYGLAPGPSRDRHFMTQWHRFKAALAKAKLTALPVPDEPGQYLGGNSRFDNRDDILKRGGKILVLANEPGTIELDFQAVAVSTGDLHATSFEALAPDGDSLLRIARLPMSASQGTAKRLQRPSTWGVFQETYALDGKQKGLYTLLFGCHESGLFQGVSKLPECQVLKSVKQSKSSDPAFHAAKISKGYLVPLAPGRLELSFKAAGTRDGSHIRVTDRRGKKLLDRGLRAGESVSVVLGGGLQEYWLLDGHSDYSGFFQMRIASPVDEPLLYGHDLKAIQLIRTQLKR